jgi:FHS family L-fucose permease-like MFS transporter
VQGVGGGAWYPPAQGSLAVSPRRAPEALNAHGLQDKASTRRSYLVPMTGYMAMTMYAA